MNVNTYMNANADAPVTAIALPVLSYRRAKKEQIYDAHFYCTQELKTQSGIW